MSGEPRQDDFDRTVRDTAQRLTEAAKMLREYCDSVMIIGTVCEGDSSQMVYVTRGNKYAIDGSVHRFLEMRSNAQALKDEENFGRDGEE